MDYSASGVDIKRADQLVDWIKSQKHTHHKDRIVSKIGGFASLFTIDFPHMKKPCLASSTDGVGTKLKLAIKYSSMTSLGQDLVAMCVNDLICVGAQPLFFLDYFACEKIDPDQTKNFIRGLQKACHLSNLALIGGETAEMPGVYQNKDFDCAGFAVGVVDHANILGSHKVKKGDQLIGLPSHGFHSNGYSLLRQVFAKDMDAWSEELLTPTALYTQIFLKTLQGKVKALAHITGGGIDNILRVVPKGSIIDLKPWKIPSPFIEVKKRTQMTWNSLLKTLNCGIGLVCIVDSKQFQPLITQLKYSQINPIDLGCITEVNPNQNSVWKMDFNQLSE